MTIKFSNEELTGLQRTLTVPLNDQTRPILQDAILNKLKPSERKILGERILKGKRVFKYEADGAGGIYSVATNKLRNINSGPGGGVGGEVYNRRGEYFWADFANEDLEFTSDGKMHKIPKGTVYITHGIADPVLDDDDDSSTVSDNVHRVTNKSMYSL